MEKNQLKSFDLIYPAYEIYKPFVEKVFHFLNGYINYDNPCTLHLNLYSNTNYAEFAKPNIIIVYLGSIINNFYGDDNKIKNIIIDTVAHELSHSVQNIDMLRYNSDPYYREKVENENEGRTELWLTNHAEEIYQVTGVNIRFSQWAIDKVQPHGKEWQHLQMRDYYLTCIADVLYRNSKVKTTLSDLFDANPTISFRINDSDRVLIKYKGEYNIRGIYSFNDIMNKYCRYGVSITYFKTKSDISYEDIFGEKGIDFHITITDQYCKPINI